MVSTTPAHYTSDPRRCRLQHQHANWLCLRCRLHLVKLASARRWDTPSAPNATAQTNHQHRRNSRCGTKHGAVHW